MPMIKIVIMAIVFIFLGVVVMTPVDAEEPKRPIVIENFDPKKRAKISEVERLPSDHAFERLKGMDFIGDDDLLNAAIFMAFKNREKNALNYAMDQLKKPRREVVDGELVDRNLDLYVAKKTFQVFPDESLPSLLDLYEYAEPAIRANIILALGGMEGDPAVRDLLVEALDDKNFFHEIDPDEEYYVIEGEPFRVCDEAYNQLVLRYEVKNVLRTIGSVHAIEDRDYHIEMLKKML